MRLQRQHVMSLERYFKDIFYYANNSRKDNKDKHLCGEHAAFNDDKS